MIKKTLTLLILPALVFISCKKEPTKWDTEWNAPVVHGHLTINDMIPVEYTEENSEGYLSLIVHEPVFGFSLDTLIELPDTTIVEKTAIAFPSIEVTPSFSLPDNYDQEYELGDIQLKRVIIESGTAEATIASPWEGKTKITFTFPKVEGPEGTFERVYYLDAGSEDSPTSVDDIIDMAFHDMDLTGGSGLLYNTIGIDVLVESNEETESFIVTNSDSISFTFAFKDMVPRYAMGYFGQYYFSDTMGIALLPMKKILAGSIDIDSIDLTMTIRNGFNLVAQSKITKLTGYNTRTSNIVELDFPQKSNTLNINPASGGLYDYVPSEYPLPVNNSNSNITDFIENLCDSIIVGYELAVNPFGNITAGSDEFFPDSKMELFLDGEFPLEFGANDLTIADTFAFEWLEKGTVTPKQGKLFVNYENGFPLGAEAKIYVMDDNYTITDSIIGNAPILPADYDSGTFLTTPQTGAITFDIDADNISNLETGKHLLLHITFNTDESGKVKIPSAAYFDFNVNSNLQISVSL